MKTFVHSWQYLANFFLEWEMFQTKVLLKIKIHILCSITFFRKPCRLWDIVEKYGRAREATDCNIVWLLYSACWITKATRTYSEICSTCCSSSVRIVSRTRLYIALHENCLSCIHLSLPHDFVCVTSRHFAFCSSRLVYISPHFTVCNRR